MWAGLRERLAVLQYWDGDLLCSSDFLSAFRVLMPELLWRPSLLRSAARKFVCWLIVLLVQFSREACFAMHFCRPMEPGDPEGIRWFAFRSCPFHPSGSLSCVASNCALWFVCDCLPRPRVQTRISVSLCVWSVTFYLFWFSLGMLLSAVPCPAVISAVPFSSCVWCAHLNHPRSKITSCCLHDGHSGKHLNPALYMSWHVVIPPTIRDSRIPCFMQ